MSLLNQLNIEVSKFASKSDTRPEIAGVFITKDHTVATDGFRLVEISVPSNVKPEDYPKVSGRKAMYGFKPFIVSARELGKIKVPASKTLPVVNHLAIGHLDDSKVEFLKTDLENEEVKTLRRIDAKFPDYLKLFPQGKPEAEVSINAEYLAEVLTTLGKLNDLKAVKIKVYKSGSPIVIEAKGQDQEARSLVMPLRS